MGQEDKSVVVLTRREGQGIRIGPDIHVRINHLTMSKVVISIECPRDVVIDRKEITNDLRVRELEMATCMSRKDANTQYNNFSSKGDFKYEVVKARHGWMVVARDKESNEFVGALG
jgi:carbon storage regulator CsrA